MGFNKTYMYNNGNSAPSRDSVKKDQGWCVYTLTGDTTDLGESNSNTNEHIFEKFSWNNEEKVLIDGAGFTWTNFRFHDSHLAGIDKTNVAGEWTNHSDNAVLRGQPFRLHIKNVNFEVVTTDVDEKSDAVSADEHGGQNKFDNFCIKTMKTVVTMDNVSMKGYGGQTGCIYGGACLIQDGDYSVIDKDIARLNYDASNNNPQWMNGKPGFKNVHVALCHNSMEFRNCRGDTSNKLNIVDCSVNDCVTNGLVLGDAAYMGKLANGDDNNSDGNSSAGMKDVAAKCSFVVIDNLTVSASNRAVVMESCADCTLKNSTLTSNDDGILVGSPTGENYLDNNTTHSGKLGDNLATGSAYDTMNTLRKNCSINLIKLTDNSGVNVAHGSVVGNEAYLNVDNHKFLSTVHADARLMCADIDNRMDVKRYNCTGPWSAGNQSANYGFIDTDHSGNEHKFNAGYADTVNVAGIEANSNVISLRGAKCTSENYGGTEIPVSADAWLTYRLSQAVIRQDMDIDFKNRHDDNVSDGIGATSRKVRIIGKRDGGNYVWSDFRYKHDISVDANGAVDGNDTLQTATTEAEALAGKKQANTSQDKNKAIELVDVVFETGASGNGEETYLDFALDTDCTPVFMYNVDFYNYAKNKNCDKGGAVRIEGDALGDGLDYKDSFSTVGIVDISYNAKPGLKNVTFNNCANGIEIKNNVKNMYIVDCCGNSTNRHDFNVSCDPAAAADDEGGLVNKTDVALQVPTKDKSCDNISLEKCMTNSADACSSFRFYGTKNCSMSECESRKSAMLANVLCLYPIGNHQDSLTDVGLTVDNCKLNINKNNWVGGNAALAVMPGTATNSLDSHFRLSSDAADVNKIGYLKDLVLTQPARGAAIIYKGEGVAEKYNQNGGFIGATRGFEGRLISKNNTFLQENSAGTYFSTNHKCEHWAYYKEQSEQKAQGKKSFGYLINHRDGNLKNTMDFHTIDASGATVMSGVNNGYVLTNDNADDAAFTAAKEYELNSMVDTTGGLLTNICYTRIGEPKNANSEYNGWVTYEIENNSKAGDSGIIDKFGDDDKVLLQSKGSSYDENDVIPDAQTMYIWKDFQFNHAATSKNFKYNTGISAFGTGGEHHGKPARLVVRNIHFKNTLKDEKWCINTDETPTTIEKCKIQGYFGNLSDAVNDSNLSDNKRLPSQDAVNDSTDQNPLTHDTPKNLAGNNVNDVNDVYRSLFIKDTDRKKATDSGAVNISKGYYASLASMNVLYGQFGRPGIRNCTFIANHRGAVLANCTNMYLANNVFENSTFEHVSVKGSETASLKLNNSTLCNTAGNAIKVDGCGSVTIESVDVIRSRGPALYCNDIPNDNKVIVDNMRARHATMGEVNTKADITKEDGTNIEANTNMLGDNEDAGGEALETSVIVLQQATTVKGELYVQNSHFHNGDGYVFRHFQDAVIPDGNVESTANGKLYQRDGNEGVQYTRLANSIEYDGFEQAGSNVTTGTNSSKLHPDSYNLFTLALSEAERLLSLATEGITVSTTSINGGANIQFVLDGADLEQVLSVLPTMPSQEEQVLTGNARAASVVSLDMLNRVFKYTSDGIDVGDGNENTDDIIFNMYADEWMNVPFSGSTVTVNQIGPNVNGSSPPIKKDIVRWEAYNLFNHWSGVDMFANESSLVADVVAQDTPFNNMLKDKMVAHNGEGTTNNNNLGKELFDQIMLIDPSRVLLQFADNNDGSSTNDTNTHTRPVPLKVGDQIVVKLTYDFTTFNAGIANMSIFASKSVPSRSYLVHLEVQP